GDSFLDGGDCGGGLEGCVVAGAIPHEHDVIVVVDKARDCAASSQVDHPDSWTSCGSCAAHGGEATVPDRHCVRDGVVAVHRVDPAVDEHELLCRPNGRAAGALPGDRTSGWQSERRPDARAGDRTEQLPAWQAVASPPWPPASRFLPPRTALAFATTFAS